MNWRFPSIIQGGMGVGISDWRLARAVSRLGQGGVVSGTALEFLMARRLQNGDEDGGVRRALDRFPFRAIAERIVDEYYRPGGRAPGEPYRPVPVHSLEGRRKAQEMSMAANFVELLLAREGHDQPVGVNYLEKIQMPLLPALYGALLAGAAVVIVGAGIPSAVPAAIDALTEHQPAVYPIRIDNREGGTVERMRFDPASFQSPGDDLPSLTRPAFLPIVSSATLARRLSRNDGGGIAGFIIEGPSAGGHNAPSRTPLERSPEGEPVYGPKDAIDIETIRRLGLPFWLAGGYGSPEGLRRAQEEGAAGIQAGTIFALCRESGMAPGLRQALLRQALAGKASVFTDPVASPTGFPFKVARLDNTLSDANCYAGRRRVCDLGYLREVLRGVDGSVAYRCPAEPEQAFLAKGGAAAEIPGRCCLCNGLLATVGLATPLPGEALEPPLVTLGSDLSEIPRLAHPDGLDYSAEDVVRFLLS